MKCKKGWKKTYMVEFLLDILAFSVVALIFIIGIFAIVAVLTFPFYIAAVRNNMAYLLIYCAYVGICFAVSNRFKGDSS